MIKSDLHLNNLEYAAVSTWFLISYSVFQTIFGGIYDRFGTRRVFSAAIVLWSISAMLHAFAGGFRGFAACRFLLGVGEAGNWPGSIKTVTEWFPAQQRAFGLSIVNTGAALGSVIAPPLVVWLQISYGWKTAFLVTGALGFVWLILWLVIYGEPAKQSWLTESEREFIQADSDIAAQTGVITHKKSWGTY